MTHQRRRALARYLALAGAVAPATSLLPAIDNLMPNTYPGHMAAFLLTSTLALTSTYAAERWLIRPAITNSITRDEHAEQDAS